MEFGEERLEYTHLKRVQDSEQVELQNAEECASVGVIPAFPFSSCEILRILHGPSVFQLSFCKMKMIFMSE